MDPPWRTSVGTTGIQPPRDTESAANYTPHFATETAVDEPVKPVQAGTLQTG